MIKTQNKKIEVLEDRVEEVQDDLKTSRRISIGSVLLTLLFIL